MMRLFCWLAMLLYQVIISGKRSESKAQIISDLCSEEGVRMKERRETPNVMYDSVCVVVI